MQGWDNVKLMSTICGSVHPCFPSKWSSAPARGMGIWEIRRGQRWRIEQKISISRITKGPCRFVVGRVLDAFDKDATGVSTLQHPYVFVLMATFSPRECLIAPVCGPRRDWSRTRTSVLFGILERGTVVLQSSPVPLFETLSNGTGAPVKRIAGSNVGRDRTAPRPLRTERPSF
jgi:hypothetical protein